MTPRTRDYGKCCGVILTSRQGFEETVLAIPSLRDAYQRLD